MDSDPEPAKELAALERSYKKYPLKSTELVLQTEGTRGPSGEKR